MAAGKTGSHGLAVPRRAVEELPQEKGVVMLHPQLLAVHSVKVEWLKT